MKIIRIKIIHFNIKNILKHLQNKNFHQIECLFLFNRISLKSHSCFLNGWITLVFTAKLLHKK